MLYGILNLPWWGDVLVSLIISHLTVVSVTVFLHRAQAHRAIELKPWLAHFFRLWLWLTTGMVTREWAAVHRKHHAKCETIDDPHSPKVFGLAKVLFEGTELYRQEKNNPETIKRYSKGTPDDWLENNLYSKHSSFGIYITLIAFIVLFGIPGVTMWAIQIAWIPFFAAGVINGVGHAVGYRNFTTKDASTNISPIGIIMGGEELHNNHHAYPTSAKFSTKWWEFDIGWLYIKLLTLFRCVKVKYVQPKVKFKFNDIGINTESLSLMLADRIDIMTKYSKSVVVPVCKQVLANIKCKDLRAYLKPAKKLLIREESLLSKEMRSNLQNMLTVNGELKVVYQLKVQLQAIWDSTTASQKELIESFNNWCRQAEATGIKSLQEFAYGLRGCNSNL